MSPDEARRLLAVARSLKVRVVLALGYGCGLRASEVVRLRVASSFTITGSPTTRCKACYTPCAMLIICAN